MWGGFLLGALQGIFEWLPISSEGIVALTGSLLGMKIKVINLALFLHMGTLFAVVVYFWRDWLEVLTLKDRKMLRFLVLATLVSLVVGFPLYNLVSRVILGAGLLLVMGIGLLLTSYLQRKDMGIKIGGDKVALVTGFLQGLSVIPGLSRSGSTIFGLSLGKEGPEGVLKKSYMMSVPVVLASSIYLVVKEPFLISGWPALVVSFVVGLISLKILMGISKKIKFQNFTLVFGLICLIGGIIGFFI